MRYRVLIEQDQDGVFVAEVPELPGCISQGQTRSEAIDNIREAVIAYLESLQTHGEPVSLQTPIWEDGDELGDFIEDKVRPLPESQALEGVLRSEVRKALAVLTPRQETVLRKRFGIESSYRQLRQARIYTCTRDPHLRLVFIAVALLLRNLWVWMHTTLLAEGSACWHKLRPQRLRFQRLLDWVAQAVVNLLHDGTTFYVKFTE